MIDKMTNLEGIYLIDTTKKYSPTKLPPSKLI